MDDNSPHDTVSEKPYVVGFQNALTELVNRYSKENGSNTPDFVLASFIARSMLAFDGATNDREKYYGRATGGGTQVFAVEAAPVPKGKESGAGFSEKAEEESLSLLETASSLLHGPLPFLSGITLAAHKDATDAWMERYDALVESLREDD